MPRSLETTFRLSSPLRDFCGGVAQLSVSAPTLRAALAQFAVEHPELYRSICDETGAVRRHVNLFINTSNARDLDGLDSALAPGDVVTVLPAVSGG
jgi:molybdopterin converting factor small subunit